MKVIHEQLRTLEDLFDSKLAEALAKQRTEMAGNPEKAIRILGLKQLAEHWESEAKKYLESGELYESQECDLFASRVRGFINMIE